MTSDAVHYLGLIEVSGRLRRGELKPTTLSETILARIAQHDGALRSYTTLLADRAMAKARQAEAELNRGLWRGPLHGVPIAVKDLCYTDYAPTAAGMLIHKDFIPRAPCKAALSSGCKAHPATAPAGSNRGRHGGDEMSEAPG